MLDAEGYPGTRPPWGSLNTINLNTGKLEWKVPLDEYEELTRRGIPLTGTENFGGATATAGDIVFCVGTRDRVAIRGGCGHRPVEGSGRPVGDSYVAFSLPRRR